jgi:hypothetical protein
MGRILHSRECIPGGLTRYKGVFLDSGSVYPERRRVNHLSSNCAIKSGAEQSRLVTHLRNSLNRLREADSGGSEFDFRCD